jgi:hypothetical protein
MDVAVQTLVVCSGAEAGGDARAIKEFAGDSLSVLNSCEELEFLNESHVDTSLLVLLTQSTFSDPCCMLALSTAVDFGLPILLVTVAGRGYEESAIGQTKFDQRLQQIYPLLTRASFDPNEENLAEQTAELLGMLANTPPCSSLSTHLSLAKESKDQQDQNQLWASVQLRPKPAHNPAKCSSSWRTVRLYVCATPTDFGAERQQLSHHIVPQLREWCEARKIQLLESDMNSWRKKDENKWSADLMLSCLQELSRCREENIEPFFLSLVGHTYGFVPPMGHLTSDLLGFNCIEGFSQTVMEIIYGAYADANCNALFALRKGEGFLSAIPPAQQLQYMDEDPVRQAAQLVLKQKLKGRFPPQQIFEYSVEVCTESGERTHSANRAALQLTGLQESFAGPILAFFKTRIASQYPLPSTPGSLHRPLSLVAAERKPHELFVDLRSSTGLVAGLALDSGRERLQRRVLSYVAGDENRVFTITKGGGNGGIYCAATVALSLGAVQRRLAAFLAPSDVDGAETTDAMTDGTLGENADTPNADKGVLPSEEGHGGGHGGGQCYSRRILVLSGAAGAGKSSLLASCVNRIGTLLPHAKRFYHFVGAAPGSTDLVRLLRRLWMELSPQLDIPATEAELVHRTPALLAQVGKEDGGVVLLLDALNQLDDLQLDTDNHDHFANGAGGGDNMKGEGASERFAWLPALLPPGVRCIVTVISGTSAHSALHARGRLKPINLELSPLDPEAGRTIVKRTLGRHRRSIDADALDALVAKSGGRNPLWLLTACEELRVHTSAATVRQKIESFAESLLGILQQALQRCEDEHGAELVEAALCMLECSRHGLLEIELLGLLERETDLAFGNLGTQGQRSLKPVSLDDTETMVVSDAVGGSGGSRSAKASSLSSSLKAELHASAQSAVQNEHGQRSEEAGTQAAPRSAGYRGAKGVNSFRWSRPKWLLLQGLRPFLRPCGEPGKFY